MAQAATLTALRHAVLAAPHDDAPRLVYADALLADGDGMGELIAVQVALSRGVFEDRARLEARERTLLRNYRAPLVASVAAHVRRVTRIERGFVSRVEIAGGDWARSGASLVAMQPIESLQVYRPDAAAMRAIGTSPPTAQLRSIMTWGASLALGSAADVADMRAFLESPYLATLEHLILHVSVAPRACVPALSTLFAGVSLPALSRIILPAHDLPIAMFDSVGALHVPKLSQFRVETRRRDVLAKVTTAFPGALVR